MEEIVNEMPSQRDGLNHPLVDQDRNIWTLIQGFQLACPIMIGLCTLATWASSFQLQKQYAWAIYRSVRGDSETKSRYLNYEVRVRYLLIKGYANEAQIYLVLVKVAVFFIICFVLQYGLVDVHFEEPEFGLTMALLPATLLLMILGVYVVRFERKRPMGFVIVGDLLPLSLCVTGLLTPVDRFAILQWLPIYSVESSFSTEMDSEL